MTVGNDCLFVKIGERFINMARVECITILPDRGYSILWTSEGSTPVTDPEEIRQLEAFLERHAATF